MKNIPVTTLNLTTGIVKEHPSVRAACRYVGANQHSGGLYIERGWFPKDILIAETGKKINWLKLFIKRTIHSFQYIKYNRRCSLTVITIDEDAKKVDHVWYKSVELFALAEGITNAVAHHRMSVGYTADGRLLTEFNIGPTKWKTAMMLGLTNMINTKGTNVIMSENKRAAIEKRLFMEWSKVLELPVMVKQ